MREINKIAEGLFEKVRDRFEDVSLGDENAMAVQDPEKARFFNFDYVVDGKNHGNITLSLIDETSLKVYFSKNISHDLDDAQKKQWYSFLKELREFAKRNLLSFEPRDITRSTLKHRDIKQVSKSDNTFSKDDVIGESRMYGTSRSSYENDGPVRIIIRHTDNINTEQRGARSRKIKAIYLENSEGERLKLPHNSLRYARAIARHCSEGGSIHDDFGQHITAIAEECAKLKPFKTAMIRRVFEDELTQHMVEAAFEYHGLLKDTLSKMTGRKGYQQCREQFEATSTSYIPEENFDVDSLKERFVKRTYNDRMNDALPIVHKAYNMKKTNKFAQQFESWAENTAQWDDETINVDDLAEVFAEELPLGVDAIDAQTAISGIINSDQLAEQLLHAAQTNPTADARDIIADWLEENEPQVYQELVDMIGDTESNDEYGANGAVYEEEGNDTFDAVVSAITRRIIMQHTDLLKAHGPEAVMDAIKDVASFNDNVDEIGSSDVSAWVHQVAQQLGTVDEGYDAKSPADSDSPLTHAQDDYCDACDSTECHCDDLSEGRVKELDIDLKQLSDEEFQAKYNKTKEQVRSELGEGQGNDYVNKDEKMKRMGAKPLSTLDKLKMMPRQMKAAVKGDSEDDLVNYNKQFNEEIAQMRKIAGLK